MMRKNNSIIVSGIGIVSPLGVGRELTWKRLLFGDSGVSIGPYGLEARVLNFSENGARSRMGDFAILAAEEALNQAQIFPKDRKKLRIGCGVSQSKPLLSSSPAFRLDPSLLLSSFFGWSAESVIQRELELEGPTTNIAAACATGIASLEWGVHQLKTNQCDAVLVGAAESSLHPLYFSGFQQLGVLAQGQKSSDVCPFGKNRSGFAIGEGAAVMVLEKYSSAQARQVSPIAAIQNVVMTHSNEDILRFDQEGESIARLLSRLTQDEKIPRYINAHGTGTVFNDLAETRGIKKAFPDYFQHVAVSSTKAATGHLLGAAGALEAAFCVLALRDQMIPPTLNLTDPDPLCDLDFVPLKSRQIFLNTTLSLSYGFGGQMGGILFGRPESSFHD